MPPKAFKNRSKIHEKDLWFFDWLFKPFWVYFGNLFSSLLLPKICQNRKRRFYENELLVYTRCSFSRISAPKIYPKIDEKNDRKMKHFFGPLLEGLGSHSVTILGSKSHLKIDQKINAILDRFLDDFGPILGSMWGPLRAPGCHRDAPKTLQDALKTLPRCSQDAQGRQ